MKELELKSLGDSKAEWSGFETFETPPGVDEVTCATSEITAVCPVTGHPDFYTVQVTYQPDGWCVESKTLKLYLQSFRATGVFCESFASKICEDLFTALQPKIIFVKVTQVPRGGVSICARSVLQKQASIFPK